ncbi:MAG: hypothetical protein BGO98_32035 [Myxococcales bacterium 68-20]|nr:hypothetical protein [Myxococcales bacterium]OJY18376.1 MAG: hypothetical protein BGO98_32035 [Myxococcales bacterium 68-20]
MTLHGIPEVLDRLGNVVLAFHGSRAVTFSRPVTLDTAEPGGLAFIRPGYGSAEAWLRKTKASVILCGSELTELADPPADKAIIVVADPRLEFLRLVRAWFAPPKPPAGVHPSAVVHPDAHIDPTAHVGPGCNIGRCTIGRGSVLHGNVHLYDGVRIGNDVTIHAGAVIGTSGFGYQRAADGTWEHFPHIGGVVIEDDVDIGANACIDRGSLADTIVKKGAKIDNLVHIAHNVVIGEHAVIIGTAQIAGSVVIGDHAWIAPSATIVDNVRIGREATVGLGSVVVKDVPDFAKTMGQPAALLPERFWNKPRS